jgi:hypothetical protein
MQATHEAGITNYMSKRESFAEAADSVLAAFTNAGADSVNSNSCEFVSEGEFCYGKENFVF